jgi:P4 family phage/plasmid primase-like protien
MNQADLLSRFLAHLHRGGSWAYWWILEGKRSVWWPVGKPLPCPNGRANAYFGVHPSHKPKGSRDRAGSADIAAVNCLFADLDAKGFDGGKQSAWEHLETLEPAPSVVVDSGGGYHAYWLLAEPFMLATDADRERARQVQARWVAFVGGDHGAKDLARVLRVPGTTNYKPGYAPDFPQVRFVRADLDRLYELEDLEMLLPEVTTAEELATNAMPTASMAPYVQAALQGELGKLALATEGARNNTLNAAAFSLGQLVGARLLDRRIVESKLEAVARAIGLEERETLATIKSGLDAGEKHPRQIPEPTRPVTTAQEMPVQSEPPTPEPGPSKEEASGLTEQERTLLSFDADDEGNAQAVNHLYGDRFLHCEAYGWMYYMGTHWEQENAEAQLERAIVDTLKRRRMLAVQAERESLVKATKPSAANVRNTKYLFRSLKLASVDDFDRRPDLLNVRNGVLDLRTGELEPHHRRQLYTYCLPVDYYPDTDTSKWETWLLEVVGNDEAVALYLQMAVGYTLTGHTWEECLFYLHGPTRAGKGTFTETLLALMGREPLATEADFTTFTRKRENDPNNADLAKLKPCRMVVASESAKNQWLNAAKIKQITGGNLIYAALKYRDHFAYRPQYTIWLVSNHPPKVDVEDDAAWVRVKVIRFPNSYAGCENKALKAHMRQSAVLRQVLTWAVQGAMMWYGAEGKGLTTPPKVISDTQAARDLLDYVGQWLTERVEKTDNPKHFVSNPTLYASYKTWCEDNGVTPKRITNLTQAMKAKGYRAGERGRIGSKQYRGCYEIQLLEL